jgi:ABC-2 type transport system permease protein
MAADTLPVLTGVLREQRRSLVFWSIALAAVSAMYIAFYPSIGGSGMEEMIASMPEELVVAMGYDRIGSAAGYMTSTVYGLLAPILLLVFAIAAGARLVAGDEEDGTLELEVTSPVERRRVFGERLLALWLDVLVLVAVLALVSYLLVLALDMGVGLSFILAASTGLYLLVIGMGTIALAIGAITGRRAIALGVAAAVAVLSFIFNAIGPTIPVGWMTAVSPFSWYLEHEPLTNGFDVPRLLLLAAIPILFAAAGLVRFNRRDLMVS